MTSGRRPEHSWLGIAWTAATLLVMLTLARGKALTGRALENRVLLTESRVTLVDAYLAGAVLVGLLLNAVALVRALQWPRRRAAKYMHMFISSYIATFSTGAASL